jgi:S1-C subfamily serine protease
LGSGETYDRIRIRAFDERKDLAILKVPGFKLPTCVLGDSDAVKVGDKLTYFGSQALAGDSPSQTEVLASGIANGLRVLEVAVVPATAGAWGPVLDTSGQVVGVLNRRLPSRADTNLVVPINYARGMLEVDEGRSRPTVLTTTRPSLSAARPHYLAH